MVGDYGFELGFKVVVTDYGFDLIYIYNYLISFKIFQLIKNNFNIINLLYYFIFYIY